MANKFAKNDEAVSAVIGVILMVAITVILAAVIAAFVFGMGSSIKKTYVVSISVDRASSGNIVITNNGGTDVASLNIGTTAAPTAAISVTLDGADVTGTTLPTGVTIGDDMKNLNSVGGSIAIVGSTGPNHVIVTGKFKDGTQQVLTTSDV